MEMLAAKSAKAHRDDRTECELSRASRVPDQQASRLSMGVASITSLRASFPTRQLLSI